MQFSLYSLVKKVKKLLSELEFRNHTPHRAKLPHRRGCGTIVILITVNWD